MLHVTRIGTPSLIRLYLRTVDERLAAMWGARLRHRGHWAVNDPYRLAERLAGTSLYLSAGDGTRVPGDPPAPGDRLLERLIGPCTHDMATRLAKLGCPARTSFGPGTHDWPSWQRELERSWPFLTSALRNCDEVTKSGRESERGDKK
jgi:diacylglycerol O-acyltransferase/trehalose O-mycolyltransferase